MKAGFVHLHNHTEYSLLDGALRITKLAKQAAKFKMPAVAITDHGNMFGAIEFYKICSAEGVNPIIGAEVYVAPGSRKDRALSRDVAEVSFHLTLLCKDVTGYRNLIKLVSSAYLEGFYYRPRVDKELLSQYNQGLIAMSGCLKGEINYYLLRGDTEKAREILESYQNIFGNDDFYLELTRLGMPENEKSIAGLMQLSSEMGAKVVATNDCHYIDASDVKAHDALVCIQTGKKVGDSKRLKFESAEVYFKSPEAMAKLFSDIPEAIHNTLKIAEKCRLVLDVDGKNFNLPAFPIPESVENKSDFDYLTKLTRAGFIERYPNPTSEIQERLKHELKVIANMGFAGYFLIVKDIIDFARSKAFPIGPGRGSAVSSLVLYSLGITDIDPIRYGLVFERFMNPERVTLPDIDIDFADDCRGDIINYIRQRYGQDSVAQIITFGTMASRAAVRDVGRVLDVPYGEVDRIAKLIPFGAKIGEAIATTKELKQLIESSVRYKELIEIAEKLEGMARHASIHASGVVIAPKPLIEFVPLYRTVDGEICTQYDMNALADVGLLKMDVLGLKTLSVIENTIKICNNQGKPLDKKSVPLDDKKTYELLQKAETTGLFQIESQGMRDILRKSKPEKLEDICAVIALYRPGPMANVDEFVNRKLGLSRIEYLHDSAKPILKETYGIMVYQEQVMQIASAVAGFTPSQYDRLRKAMGKKIPEEMEAMRATFIDGAKAHHFTEAHAVDIFNSIAPFAGYGFNKSHSIGYAHLSYMTAYLKANYPVEYMTALLSSEISDSDKLNILIKDCRKIGVEVFPPDINCSNHEFTIEDNPAPISQHGNEQTEFGNNDNQVQKNRCGVRYGLGGIKHLGQKVCEAIANERQNGPYQSFRDFLKRTRKDASRKVYEMLIKAGALDTIHKDRTSLLSQLEEELEKVGSERLQYLERQNNLFSIPNQVETDFNSVVKNSPVSSTCKEDMLKFEKEAFGFYFSCHPLESFETELSAIALVPINKLDSLLVKQNEARTAGNGPRKTIHLGGVVVTRQQKKDRKGQDYAIFNLEDLTGSTEIIVFSDVYDRTRQFLIPDATVIVRGRIGSRNETKTQIEAQNIIPFSDWQSYFDNLVIAISAEQFSERGEAIKNILAKYEGTKAIFFKVTNPDQTGSIYRQNEPGVTFSKELITDLAELLGKGAAKIGRNERQ
jgi:DNA polymerase-3 subunit alpha